MKALFPFVSIVAGYSSPNIALAPFTTSSVTASFSAFLVESTKGEMMYYYLSGRDFNYMNNGLSARKG